MSLPRLLRLLRGRGPLLWLLLALVPLTILLILAVLLVRGLEAPLNQHVSLAPEADLLDAEQHMLGLSLLEDTGGSEAAAEMSARVSELLRIKRSVQKELVGLEKALGERRRQEAALIKIIDDLKAEANRRQADMERMQVNINKKAFMTHVT